MNGKTFYLKVSTRPAGRIDATKMYWDDGIINPMSTRICKILEAMGDDRYKVTYLANGMFIQERIAHASELYEFDFVQ